MPAETEIIQLPLSKHQALIVSWALSLSYASLMGDLVISVESLSELRRYITIMGEDELDQLNKNLDKLIEVAWPSVATKGATLAFDSCQHCSHSAGDVCCYCGEIIPPLS